MKKNILWSCFLLALTSFAFTSLAADPLRVFIRSGPKTHGPGQHDHPRFLTDWKELLNQRGMKADGAQAFPTAAQLAETDVLVMFAADAGRIAAADRTNLEAFLKRGGGIVAIHDAVCGNDPHWFKTIIGGAWEHGHSKWYEGQVGFYIVDPNHPITRGISNFDFKDEIYWELHLQPEARVLASSFRSVFNIAPQMWVYEKENYRAFVCIPGHEYVTFSLPHVRAMLLRGIAWAGKQEADKYVNKEELASLRYPVGGPTAPDKAAAKIEKPAGFDINLVAAEPLIEKVISLDWDEKGRMWVAETPEYPNGRRINKNDSVIAQWRESDPKSYTGQFENRPARDRISVLTDSNGDGVLDKKTVFYSGLELVTSLVPYRDGVIVSQAPDIFWLRDTDGDGTADKKETVFTGFGVSDSHAVISNMRWGMDGWIYATLGYSAATPKSGDGKREFPRLGSGVIRFKPDASDIEMVSSKGGNTWGLDFSWENELFFTQANGTHLQHVVLPERVLAKGRLGTTPSYKTIENHRRVYPLIQYKEQAYLQIDNVGGFTAASGSMIYDGGAWPQTYAGSHFVAEPTVNLVHEDILKPDGSTYVASKREEREFIGSRDLWFRPIHQRVGPDGAMYLVDFYNQAAVHNDTRGPKHGANNAAVRPDRDHHFARIYRVQHQQAAKLDQPVLARTDRAGLIKALEHPNAFYRMTAHRLLWENPEAGDVANLAALVRDSKLPAARIIALWTLNNQSKLAQDVLLAAMKDPDAAVRKNAVRIFAENKPADGAAQKSTLTALLKDPDARVRLNALTALGTGSPDSEAVAVVVAAYPEMDDPWLKSAAIGVAIKAPTEFTAAIFKAANPDAYTALLSNIIQQSAAPDYAVRLITLLSGQPAQKDALKQIALESLAASLKPELSVEWTPALRQALQNLLGNSSDSTAGAALPLIARLDKNGSLSAELGPLMGRLLARLQNAQASDDERSRLAASLVGVRSYNKEILPAVTKLTGAGHSQNLRKSVLETLGTVSDAAIAAALIQLYPGLPSDLQTVAFTQLTKRPEWASALVEAIQKNTVTLGSLGPLAVHRLRTYPDRAVAERASKVIEEIRGPEAKEKDALIAKLLTVVQQPGNVENGHKIFTQNCAVCHNFKNEGRDVAPDLTGMGAHGPLELLVQIVDPNRVVEPNYVSVSVETKDDQVVDGILARESQSTLLLRNAAGDVEVKKSDIKTQRSTGLSLMPNGFEALGGEALRDLLAFIASAESRYRFLDLQSAVTADSTRGIFQSNTPGDTLSFRKFGLVKAGEVPFEIINPVRHPKGLNLVVLKGLNGVGPSYPQEVQIKAGVRASKLHFLGGVGGWAFPCCGDNKNENMPVTKVTVHYSGGAREEFVVKNGVEVSDYISRNDVNGSEFVPGLVSRGQVRTFSLPLKRQEIIDHVTLASYNNSVLPVYVAVTAELADGQSPATAATAATPKTGGPNVLIVGGGASHDYNKWFRDADTAILEEIGSKVRYTDQTGTIAAALPGLDLLYICNNHPISDLEARKGIFKHAESGKGLLLLHAGLWYNWRDWPEYNQKLVGGGARSHNRFGEFEVKLDQPDHPIFAGVPKSFKINDELYHFIPDPQGTPIKVLATAHDLQNGKTYPSIWLTDLPGTRVLCVALGHDGQAHNHPAFRKLLQNAAIWLGGKK